MITTGNGQFLFNDGTEFQPRDSRRRIGTVRISDQVLLDMLRAPSDTVVIGLQFDSATGVIDLLIHHPELLPLSEGQQVADVSPTYCRTDGWVSADWGRLGVVEDRPTFILTDDLHDQSAGEGGKHG